MNFSEFKRPENLIECLSKTLSQNESIQDEKTKKTLIEDSFNSWVVETSILDQINWINSFNKKRNRESKEKHAPTKLELFAVGMLGLARQRVVSLNTQLKTANTEQKAFISNLLDEVEKSVYAVISPDTAPLFTIHGGAIHWAGEIAQDRGTSYERLGRTSEALELYNHYISQLENELQKKLDKSIGGQKRKINTKNKFIHNSVILFNQLPQLVDYQSASSEESALRSALAVLKLRKGKLQHLTKDVWEGILLQRSAMKSLKNDKRMDDLTRMASVAALKDSLRIWKFNLPWILLTLGYTSAKAYSHDHPIQFIRGK